MTHEQRASRRLEISRRVQAGESPKALAAEYGVDVETIRTACRTHGISPRQDRQVAPKAMAVLARLWDPARPMEAIARDLGVTKQRVHQVYQEARDAGVPVPDRAR